MLPTILAWISLLSSFLLLVVFYTFRSHYPALLDRVSLRLIASLSIVNMFYANSQIVVLGNEASLVCGITTITMYLLALLSLFLIASVALNLQLVYLHSKRNAVRYEKWYVVFSTLLAAMVTTLSWALGGYDTEQGMVCGAHGRDFKDPSHVLWAVLSFDAWAALVLAYCGCVLTVIGIVLVRRVRASRQKEQQDIAKALEVARHTPGFQEQPTHVVRRDSAVYRDQVSTSVARLLLFLLIPWIVYAWTLVADVDALLNETSKPSETWVAVSQSATASQGIFVFIAFCFDANVRRVYKEMKEDLSEWYIEGTHEIVEMRNQSKQDVPRTTRLARWIVKHVLVSQEDISKAAGHDTVFNPDMEPGPRSIRDRSIIVMPPPAWQEQKHRQGMENAAKNTSNVVSLGRPSMERPTSQFFLGLTPPPPGRDPRKFSVINLGETAPPTSAGNAPGRTLEEQRTPVQQAAASKADWSTLALL